MPKVLLKRTLAVVTLSICLSCDLGGLLNTDVNGNSTQLTESEVVEGLKTALSVGIDTASLHLSVINGYLLNQAVKILLPPDVSTALGYAEELRSQIKPITSSLELVGITVFDFSVFDGLRDSLIVSMNRAAERAAPLSVNIFKYAITGITIQDGFSILRGDSTAATGYLKTQTFDPLTNVYEPFVDSTLNLVGAQVYWRSLSQNYNALALFYQGIPALLRGGLPSLPFDTLSTDLALFTTQKALSGLFLTVGQQETLIRRDPIARVTEILRKVFGSLGSS
jgi:hypothetical protein